MGYIVIDTCVWIELAGKPPLHVLLQELATYCTPPPHQLVLPDSVKVEFERHRKPTSVAWAKSIDGHVGSLKLLARFVPGLDKELATVRAAAAQKTAEATSGVQAGLDTVDKLFASAKLWTPTNKHFEDTCNRCVSIRPPAHKQNRSSVGDCLIWNAVVALLDSACVWFCTSNTGDFSEEKRDDHLHPALAEEIKDKKHTLYYYHDPTKFVEDLRERAAKGAPTTTTPVVLPQFYNYSPSPPATCPRCGASTFTPGAYLRSQYGGLTLQYVCLSCGSHYDTGEFWE